MKIEKRRILLIVSLAILFIIMASCCLIDNVSNQYLNFSVLSLNGSEKGEINKEYTLEIMIKNVENLLAFEIKVSGLDWRNLNPVVEKTEAFSNSSLSDCGYDKERDIFWGVLGAHEESLTVESTPISILRIKFVPLESGEKILGIEKTQTYLLDHNYSNIEFETEDNIAIIFQ